MVESSGNDERRDGQSDENPRGKDAQGRDAQGNETAGNGAQGNEPGKDDKGSPEASRRPFDPATQHFQGLQGSEPDALADAEAGLSTDDHATIEALRSGTALLLVLRGPNTGARFLLDAPTTTTGRHPDSDIFLDDVTVSRKHAVFQVEGDSFVVRDVGSLNGTYVNRELVDQAVLRPGDEVQIGKYRLVFYPRAARTDAVADSHPRAGRPIGAVLEELRAEFPDVTVSKIRFLEARGLVRPQRTAAGYRSFDAEDVERLRYILTAQRDRFWPLKVIREALDAMDRGLQPVGEPDQRPRVPTPEQDPQVPAPQDLSRPAKPLRLTRAEVLEASGLSPAMLDALVAYGLLQPDSGGHFDAYALPIATSAAALASYGIEARHLRPFRTAADREIGLAEQVVAPVRGRDPERGDVLAAQILSHGLALHTALVRAALRA